MPNWEQIMFIVFFFDGQRGGVAPHLKFVLLTGQNASKLLYIGLLYKVHLDRRILGSLSTEEEETSFRLVKTVNLRPASPAGRRVPKPVRYASWMPEV